MSKLIAVNYYGKKYPSNIRPSLSEWAAHFDMEPRSIKSPYSLHTEYSFKSRKFSSTSLKNLDTIKKSHYQYIPKLWSSKEWAREFSQFIKNFTSQSIEPEVIEIHPPFKDYSSIDNFLEVYRVFENDIRKKYNSIILIENRSGTRYKKSPFLISTIEDLIDLSNKIDENKLNLKITLDLPQLINTEYITKRNYKSKMNILFNKINQIKHNIGGIHLWGKKYNSRGYRESHIGNLDDYFLGDKIIKNYFLNEMIKTFNDNQARYFVPEVNSNNEDLLDIVNDLISVGFEFI